MYQLASEKIVVNFISKMNLSFPILREMNGHLERLMIQFRNNNNPLKIGEAILDIF
jgi:tetrahydromethanopterin S-methyltransferase subunit A